MAAIDASWAAAMSDWKLRPPVPMIDDPTRNAGRLTTMPHRSPWASPTAPTNGSHDQPGQGPQPGDGEADRAGLAPGMMIEKSVP